MNERTISLLRTGRTALQTVVEPIDWTARVLNNKKGYPPLRVRQKVGGLNDFEGSGAEYIAYLKLLCGLKPGMNVLDIGCGCGLMCIPVNENSTLPEYIKPGSYCGMDTDGELINWCDKNVKLNNGFFIHLNGKHIPGLEETVDVVLCKSLFTHLLIQETKGYLEEIKRLLRPGGHCLSTWFLIRENDTIPQGRYTFKHASVNGHVYYERPSNRRLAVAYEEYLLLNLLKRLDFSIKVWYGSWHGTGGGLSFQDIIVLRKA